MSCECTHTHTQLHFLSCTCGHAQSVRTFRHTAIRNSFETAMIQAGCTQVESERPVACNSTGIQVHNDLVATVNGVRSNYDVSVATPDYTASVLWPSTSAVNNAVQRDIENPRQKEPYFFWEDHRMETPHPTVVHLRKFRQLAIGVSVNPCITTREAQKHRHYRGTQQVVIPIVSTAGGALGLQYRALIEELCTQLAPERKQIGKCAKFSKNLLAKMSIITVRSSFRLAHLDSTLTRSSRVL